MDGWGRRSGGVQRIASRQTDYLSAGGELAQGLDDPLIAHLEAGSELVDGLGFGRLREQLQDLGRQGIFGWRGPEG